jgi:hypothetical protein
MSLPACEIPEKKIEALPLDPNWMTNLGIRVNLDACCYNNNNNNNNNNNKQLDPRKESHDIVHKNEKV